MPIVIPNWAVDAKHDPRGVIAELVERGEFILAAEGEWWRATSVGAHLSQLCARAETTTRLVWTRTADGWRIA